MVSTSARHPITPSDTISPQPNFQAPEVWLQDDIFLATKFGMVLGDPEYVATAIHRSPKVFQTDHVDLWYLVR